jgi:hypothetical protein
MAINLETEAKEYVSQIREDARQVHARNDQYWHSRHKRNIGVIIYLASTPALIILAFLSRFLGWF